MFRLNMYLMCMDCLGIKIFLYKEDFGKFIEGYEQALSYIKEQKPEYFEEQDLETEEEN